MDKLTIFWFAKYKYMYPAKKVLKYLLIHRTFFLFYFYVAIYKFLNTATTYVILERQI